jgi:hypothetical protein
MIARMSPITVTLCTCAMMIAPSGCSRSFTARQYPAFYEPNLVTVAVVPFQNDTRTRRAGLVVAEDLAAALHINGTYSVIRPGRLQTLIKDKGLAPLSRTDRVKDAQELRELGTVQAFIIGRVLRESRVVGAYPDGYDYYGPYVSDEAYTGPAHTQLVDEDDEDEDEGDEDFGDDYGDYYDYDFGHFHRYWYWDYPHYYYYPEYVTEAHVAIEASLVRVSDGRVLYSTPLPIWGRANLRSSSHIPFASAAFDAMHHAVAKLVDDIAGVPVEVRVYSQNDLKTAIARENGQWIFRDAFSPSDPTIYVVVRLPAPLAHNTFRVTITPKGRPRDVVVAKDFTWPPYQTSDGVPFAPSEIVERAGTGSYTAHFYSMGESVMEHDFKIK